MKRSILTLLVLITSFLAADLPQHDQTIHRDHLIGWGAGSYLEIIDQQQILHLEGTPYELGYQHGALLKEQIQHNIDRFITKIIFSDRIPPVVQNFLNELPEIMPFIPQEFLDEIQGMADGSHIPYEQLLLLNLFPEMFHCSAVVARNSATHDGTLYHVRVLDYAAAATIQDTAVLLVVKPEKGNAFLNVSYAGFIGSITGMNDQKISIGEIGGKGYGDWKGLPMAFLLRQILQTTSSLEEIKNLLETTPRTCEYYYIFADGKTRDAFAVYATPKVLQFINPGVDYLLPSSNEVHVQPNDCILLSRGNCFSSLVTFVQEIFGKITVPYLQNMIKPPIGVSSNLHNAIFAPETLDVWISHAGQKNEPAYTQPYHHYNLKLLMGR